MLRRTLAARSLTRHPHPHSDKIMAQVLATRPRMDPVQGVLAAVSMGTFVGTTAIITDWIYQSHLDLWDGTYGLDDDDDDEDD